MLQEFFILVACVEWFLYYIYNPLWNLRDMIVLGHTQLQTWKGFANGWICEFVPVKESPLSLTQLSAIVRRSTSTLVAGRVLSLTRPFSSPPSPSHSAPPTSPTPWETSSSCSWISALTPKRLWTNYRLLQVCDNCSGCRVIWPYISKAMIHDETMFS